jgi:UDP-galactopyranose mutase
VRALIVGAGFYGAVMARTLTDAGWRCLVVERQEHVGGHCHTEFVPEVGCHRHVCGPHIFHTADPAIWEYAQRFASFNHFVNRLKVNHRGKLYSFPINLMTLYQLWGVSSPAEAAAALDARRIAVDEPANMEEWCLATIGREIYETFIEGYTTKQWGRHPRDLPASIVKRIPIRLTFDDNYFDHPHQGIPVGGYTAMVERILEGIPVGGYTAMVERILVRSPVRAVGRLGDVSSFVVAFGVDDPAASAGRDA